ncbi:MAG: DUF1800 domain-containing protein [Saprospiraceae bacterium]|nr:DUF1800 domain-containing protein [Saprospiraceae bacterium]
MDRRATIATLLGKQTQQRTTAATSAGSLAPYTGPFDRAAASHLLRRVTFGANYDQIRQAETEGLATTIAKIFTQDPEPQPPINHRYESDPGCAIGETWIDQPYTLDDEIRAYRQESLYAWTGFLMYKDNISIHEKLVLFWHNHFVTGDINDPKFVYQYSKTLRENALGNFREFTKAITVDPSMLIYLNGNDNVASSPNENFARELVELFTVGKGDLVGPGDYTNYTEDDIQAMSKVLTGWTSIGYFAQDATPVGIAFSPTNHDNSTKQLSHRFGNASISAAGTQEYKNLIDIIFQQRACAEHICRKIYRFFIGDNINTDIENDIIQPLADLMIANDYEIQPVLETLFMSEHFFSDAAYGCVIKNPIDYFVGMGRNFELSFDQDMLISHMQSLGTLYAASFLGMSYYNPPGVAGWKAYYQEPTFHQIWINSVTLPNRMGYAYVLINQGFDFDGFPIYVDPLTLVDKMDSPADPNSVITEFAMTLLPRPLSIGQIGYLKQVLIPGLPDFEWEVEYLEYTGDPTNEQLANGVRNKLKNLLTVILTMAEYQLM